MTATAAPRSPEADVLARRLSGFARLSPEEAEAVAALSDGSHRTLAAKRDLIREGDPAQSVFLITSGWACRHRTLADGRRQIVALLLPGDLCDLNNHILRTMDHSIGAITAIGYAEIAHERIGALAVRHPRVAQALWWQLLVGVAVQREWTLNNGQRSAMERIGHLFCETFHRLRVMGLTHGNGCVFPLTQNDLAEATGLTPVHVNRTLQEMRASGLIRLKDRQLELPDLGALEEAVLFTPDYLHLEPLEPDGDRERTGLPIAI